MDLQDSNAIDTWLAGFGTVRSSPMPSRPTRRAGGESLPRVFGRSAASSKLDSDAFRCQQIGAANGPTYHDTLLVGSAASYRGHRGHVAGRAPSPFCSCP
jgi:hypothetical protein